MLYCVKRELNFEVCLQFVEAINESNNADEVGNCAKYTIRQGKFVNFAHCNFLTDIVKYL
jgi:hypothetical protein